MSFRAFYESIGADYDALLRRMHGKEAFVEKYIHLFLADSTYDELVQSMAEGDFEAASMKAHTLKGVALNLNLEKLSSLCSDMSNSVRSGNALEIEAQFAKVKAEYAFILENCVS